MNLASAVNEMRPFLPASDFAVSREFYRLLGFHETWSSDQLALLELGRFSFFLQNYFVKEWAHNAVMSLSVDDVDACWTHLQSLNLSSRFPNTRLGPPEVDAAASIRRGHFVDPSGVLWHFSQPLSPASGSSS